jgi:hypothetical protein
MSDYEDTFEIQKRPVPNRNEDPAKLFGFSLPEWGLMLSVPVIALVLSGSRMVILGSFLGAYGYVKFLKDILPDRFFSNAIAFYRLKCRELRAMGRDSEWRPPITK